ncbi:prostaglandin E synthase isoform X2 [Monodelphis domestica]|uniref:prostaglandin E synthase isoform X2 n=1 Tax=Monodelphis domestica TaxID=13616 RepID=UPI0024E1FA5A|nr:prostaglandin E synthase isoform X2 [Monodelphis domestica]
MLCDEDGKSPPFGQALEGDKAPASAHKMMDNEVFVNFLLYSTILVIKMYLVAVITGQVRLRKKAFANPEDALKHGGLQFCRTDPDVERCRRAHGNDLENILPFLFLGSIYSFLNPDPFIAWLHFFIFFVGRIIHTVAYLVKLKAPIRSVAYTVAQVPCVSMALQILWEVVKL